MEPTTLALIVTGLLIGVASGMLGIGGAVILVPVLVLLFGFTQGRAQGTSIGALLPPVGIFAAAFYYRAGLLDVRVSALLALGFVCGALGGAALVPYIPQLWLKRIFATILVYVAAQLVFADPTRRSGAVLPGVIAGAALWVVYAVQRRLGGRPAPPSPPPPSDDLDYHI